MEQLGIVAVVAFVIASVLYGLMQLSPAISNIVFGLLF